MGSHVGNPLLFLHRDLSLSEVRVKTQKVTREYLLRRLRFTVLSVLVAGALGVGAYWAFLDGHQYLQLDNTVVLVHGYPGLSGFGLPKEDWRFPFGADALLSSHPLSRTPVVLPRSVNAEEQLALALRPGSRALVRVWAGKYAEARDILLSSRGTPDWGNDGIMALKGVTVAGHEAQLIKLIPKLSPDESVAAILALAKSDPERAITAFRSSPAGAVAGLELTVLASWSARCTPAVQKWLDSFSGRKGWVPVKTIATTAVISGCVFPEDLLYQNSSATRDAMMALRLTSPARAAELGAQLKAELERIAGANVLNPSDRRTFLTGSAVALFTLNASRYLETVPCLPKLLQTADYGQTDEVAREARIASALLIVRGCKDYRLSIEPQAQALSVGILSPQESRTEIARVSLIPPVSADILPLLDAMIKFRAQGVSQALEAVLNTMPDGLLRSALIERLAFLNETHTDPIQWRLPDQPMLDRAILSLLARQDSQRTSAWFRSLFAQQPDSTLVEALEWVPLTPEDKVAIRLSAEHYSPLLRTMTLALIGEPEVVARLLTDRRPEIRAWAAQYAPLRSDWELIRARTQELGRYPGEVLAKATATREELEQLSVWIARTPAWDREWFLGTLEHDRANNSAAQLHLSKLRRAYALAP